MLSKTTARLFNSEKKQINKNKNKNNNNSEEDDYDDERCILDAKTHNCNDPNMAGHYYNNALFISTPG